MDDRKDRPRSHKTLSRRSFSALSAAAGVAGVTGAGGARAATVVATDVSYKTPDGTVDAALFHPGGKGAWPAVLYWPDAYGLRPTTREEGRRLAGEGYVVLVVNQFYRGGKAGVSANLDMNTDAGRARFAALRAPLTPTAVMSDTRTAFAYLDGLKVVNTKAKAGVTGYCMGGAMAMQTAAALPDRIGGAASFHGGGLVTDKPDSPHLLVPRIKAKCYFGVADNDDQKEPAAKDALRTAFEAAGNPAKIEVYKGANHGWTQPDRPVYNAAAAKRAWAELLALYRSTLV